MVPTRLGLSLVAIAGTFYTLAWLTRIGWLYIGVSLALSTLILNLVLPPLNIRGLTARRRLKIGRDGKQVEIFEDDKLTVELRLSSQSLIPKIVITLRESCPCAALGGAAHGFLIGTLPPRGRAELCYELRCYRRGVYSFPPLGVQTSAPFGLFRASRTIDAPLEVTVYPKALPIETTPIQGAFRGESAKLPQPGFTGDLRGSREFQHSDELRKIHWRNSARSGHLMVKEFDQTPRGELRMAFNPGIDLGQGRDTTTSVRLEVE